MEEELDWVKRTRRAVARGSPVFLSLLVHDDAMVRQVAPFTLARSAVRDRHAAAQMVLRAREERDELVGASLLLGIGSLAEPLDKACTEFLADEMAAARAPIVRLAAALALRRVGGEAVLERVVPVVLETAGSAMERGEELIWIQMGKEFFSEVDDWLGGPSEARFDFFKRLVERTAGSVRASAVFAMMHLCNLHPEIAILSEPLMTTLLGDEDAEVRRNALWLLDDDVCGLAGQRLCDTGRNGRAGDRYKGIAADRQGDLPLPRSLPRARPGGIYPAESRFGRHQGLGSARTCGSCRGPVAGADAQRPAWFGFRDCE